MKPEARKQAVTHMITKHKLNERSACLLVSISRTGYRYQPKPRDDEAQRLRLKELAAKQTAYGYLFLHRLLKNEGLVTNKKRTYRIYTEERLQVRTKKRKKLQRPRQPMVAPVKRNQRWSMDFVSDQLSHGRRFRVLNLIDDYSREVIDQLVSFSISGQQVARFLDRAIDTRGKPDTTVCDNGTEFTSKAMFFWSQTTRVKLGFIQPGKPTQNAFVESLNGKFRNECLIQHWFRTLEEARAKIDDWRYQYNHVRPHSSLNYLPPVVFAEQAA